MKEHRRLTHRKGIYKSNLMNRVITKGIPADNIQWARWYTITRDNTTTAYNTLYGAVTTL